MYALSIYKSGPELFSILTIICTSIYVEMGRGRNGPVDQSVKKPKISKNKQRGAYWERFHPHYKQQHNSLFLSEDLLAEMKKMSPQNLMNILLQNKNVNRESQQVYMPKMVSISNNCQLSDGIKKTSSTTS